MDPKTGPVGTDVNREGLGIEAHREQLLPGLADDFTLGEIAPKLRWTSLCWLASESPAWLHAMRNREIYDARVLYRAQESLVILRFERIDAGRHKLDLYSTKDGFYFELPPLRVCKRRILVDDQCGRGIPSDCECVTLNGKIYVLGGEDLEFCHVYALDLAGPKRQWKQCASMLRPKKDFGCVVLDRKIYALGKAFGNRGDAEVYDPKGDKWSLIEPVPYRQYQAAISAVGGEVVVLSSQHVGRPILGYGLEYTADVYHPFKDEWRVVRLLPVNNELECHFFMAEGKLYRMQQGCIFVLDMDIGRWTLRHHYSFAGLGLRDYESPILTICIRKVGDELLATGYSRWTRRMWLLQSEGFGGKNVDIAWHKSKRCSSSRDYRGIPIVMYPIEL